MKIVVLTIISLFCLFALHRERADQPNCYLEGMSADTDTERIIHKKLLKCLSADSKTVKWRRSLIASCISFVLIMLLLHGGEFPSYRDSVIYIAVFYAVYYSMWENYTAVITDKVQEIGRKHILRLRKLRRSIDA